MEDIKNSPTNVSVKRKELEKKLLEKTYVDDDFEILCRDKEIMLLKNLLGKDGDSLPSSIYIHGLKGTGKVLVTTSVCKELNINVCRTTCFEISLNAIFEDLLNQLAGFIPSQENNYGSYSSVSNMLDFVKKVTAILENTDERYCIVLENAEKLFDHLGIFAAFSLVQELCFSDRICVIFISRVEMELFDFDGIITPTYLHFPQYNQEQIKRILIANRTYYGISEEHYSFYINYLIGTFYMATRDLPELLHLAEIIFPAYCQPIINGEASENDTAILACNIKSKLKFALSSLYLKEISGEQFLQKQKLMPNPTDSSRYVSQHSDSYKFGSQASENLNLNMSSQILRTELPYYSKFLLAAAYIASYNPVRTDKRFFVKSNKKQKKTKASIKAQQKFSSEMVGPKQFPLARLTAIFYAILEEKRVQPSLKLLSQIRSLVSLGLLSIVGPEENLENLKYKCNISLERIRDICLTIDFDIIKYLYAYTA